MIKSLAHIPLQEVIQLGRASDHEQSSKLYLGSPRRHPSDDSRIVLVTRILEGQRNFLEFKKADIVRVEEAQTVSSQDGEAIALFRVWVRLGSLGIELRPFRVETDKDEMA